MPYGCGILISTTFAVAATFSETTVARRCDLNRCGGYDPGYGWRAAVQLCMDKHNGITGVTLDTLNITDSVSDGLSIIGNAGALSNAVAANVNIPNYGVGAGGRNGLWARSDAIGSMTLSNCAIVEYSNDSANFTFNTAPPAQAVLGIIVGGDSTVTISYATTPGFAYHVESTVSLTPAAWSPVAGSPTNATGSAVIFTDPNPLPTGAVYYRTVSP
jgi:hypothetical protein